MSPKIGAGIVLYNPEIGLLRRNIEALHSQVDKILLYDNGSENVESIKKLLGVYTNLILIQGEKNRGIAFALNQILDWAKNEKYSWVLTMDQDSICSKNLIKEYTPVLSMVDVALICPFVLNNGKYTFEEYRKLNLPDTTEISDPVKCITSGCLVNIDMAKELGGFNDQLFIDCVDIDLNCKVLEANKRIIRVNNAYLIQQMGKGKKIPLLEKIQSITGSNLLRRAKVVAVYSDKRLYYYVRNTRYIRKKYKKPSRQTSAWFVAIYLLYFSIFYPSNRSRIKMWKSIIKGLNDSKSILEK